MRSLIDDSPVQSRCTQLNRQVVHGAEYCMSHLCRKQFWHDTNKRVLIQTLVDEDCTPLVCIYYIMLKRQCTQHTVWLSH